MIKFRSPAMRRYFLRVFVLMSIYLISLVAAVGLIRSHTVSGLAAYALAVLPAIPILGVVWAVMRLLVEEPDEFLRMLMVRQALFATGFTLIIMTIWESLQNFDLVAPGNGGFGSAFFWFMGLGVGAIYNKLTLGTAGSCA